MPAYPNKYASSVVVTQEFSRPSASRPSAMSSPGSSRASSSSPSMNSSTSSYSDRYRSAASTDYYVDVKERTARDGKRVVVVNHKGQQNTAKGEPTPSNYSSRDSSSSKSSRR